MADAGADRRGAVRHPLVLEAEIVELPRGAKMNARTSDVSRTGCYIDTLNPVHKGCRIRLRLTHNHETVEALGFVVYTSPGLGMGVAFSEIAFEQLSKLENWMDERVREY